jgi:hypothetical protein
MHCRLYYGGGATIREFQERAEFHHPFDRNLLLSGHFAVDERGIHHNDSTGMEYVSVAGNIVLSPGGELFTNV